MSKDTSFQASTDIPMQDNIHWYQCNNPSIIHYTYLAASPKYRCSFDNILVLKFEQIYDYLVKCLTVLAEYSKV